MQDRAGAVSLILLQFIVDLKAPPAHKDEVPRQQRQLANYKQIPAQTMTLL